MYSFKFVDRIEEGYDIVNLWINFMYEAIAY